MLVVGIFSNIIIKLRNKETFVVPTTKNYNAKQQSKLREIQHLFDELNQIADKNQNQFDPNKLNSINSPTTTPTTSVKSKPTNEIIEYVNTRLNNNLLNDELLNNKQAYLITNTNFLVNRIQNNYSNLL